MKIIISTLGLFYILFAQNLFAKNVTVLNCAIATGYPPYQYLENNKPAGIDVQWIEVFNHYNKEHIQIKINPMLWNDAIAYLSFTKKIDCIWGMEINQEREKKFKFASTLYKRYSTLFVLASSKYKTRQDLEGEVISGDHGSRLNEELELNKAYRIIRVNTKEEAFDKLITNTVKASILPKDLGLYFSKSKKVKLRIIEQDNIGSPVSVAAKDPDIVKQIQEGVNRIPKEKLISLSSSKL